MGLYKKFRKYVTGKRLEWPIPFRTDRKLEEIYVRDPYIVTDDNGGYLLAGTIYHLNYNDSYGTVVYKSCDKELWSGPYLIVDKAKQERKYKDFGLPKYTK